MMSPINFLLLIFILDLRLYFLTFQSIIFIIVLGFACLLHFNERLLSQSMNYVRNVKGNISKMTVQQQNSQNYIGLQHRFNDILGYRSTLEFSLIQFTINSYIILLAFVYSPPNNTQIGKIGLMTLNMCTYW